MRAPPPDQPDSQSRAPLSVIDRLNAQNMRWRLRRDMGDRSLDESDQFGALLKLEEDRLWKLLAELGMERGLGGLSIPTEPEHENVAAGLYFKLKQKWEEGELRYFTLSYIRKAAEEYVEKFYRQDSEGRGRNAPSAPAPDVEELPSPTDSSRDEQALVGVRDFFGAAFEELGRDEAYMLGAFVVGEGAQGWQRTAARAIGKDDNWAHRVKARLFGRLRRLGDLPDRTPGREARTDDPE